MFSNTGRIKPYSIIGPYRTIQFRLVIRRGTLPTGCVFMPVIGSPIGFDAYFLRSNAYCNCYISTVTTTATPGRGLNVPALNIGFVLQGLETTNSILVTTGGISNGYNYTDLMSFLRTRKLLVKEMILKTGLCSATSQNITATRGLPENIVAVNNDFVMDNVNAVGVAAYIDPTDRNNSQNVYSEANPILNYVCIPMNYILDDVNGIGFQCYADQMFITNNDNIAMDISLRCVEIE